MVPLLQVRDGWVGANVLEAREAVPITCEDDAPIPRRPGQSKQHAETPQRSFSNLWKVSRISDSLLCTMTLECVNSELRNGLQGQLVLRPRRIEAICKEQEVVGAQMSGAQNKLSHRIDLLPSVRQETFTSMTSWPCEGYQERRLFLKLLTSALLRQPPAVQV